MNDQLSEIQQTLDTITSELLEDKRGIEQLRKEFNDLKLEFRILSERFPDNFDRKLAYSAQEAVVKGFREIVKPNPEPGLKRLTTSIRRLLKGVKNNG